MAISPEIPVSISSKISVGNAILSAIKYFTFFNKNLNDTEFYKITIEGDTDISRIWREKVDPYWTKETGREITPRLVLQEFGTDCMRNGFDDSIWVSLVKKQMIDNPHLKYVIPDVRFPNEMNMIKELSGEVWQVRRGDLPEWWGNAVLDNNTDSELMKNHDIHPSEWKWIDSNDKFENIIYNNSSLEELYSQVEKTLSM